MRFESLMGLSEATAVMSLDLAAPIQLLEYPQHIIRPKYQPSD